MHIEKIDFKFLLEKGYNEDISFFDLTDDEWAELIGSICPQFNLEHVETFYSTTPNDSLCVHAYVFYLPSERVKFTPYQVTKWINKEISPSATAKLREFMTNKFGDKYTAALDNYLYPEQVVASQE